MHAIATRLLALLDRFEDFLTMNRQLRRSLNAQFDRILIDAQHLNHDLAIDDDAFVQFRERMSMAL